MLILGIGVGNLRLTVLTVYKVGHHPRVQRTRAKQCHQCNHVFEVIWLEALNQIFHTARFKLEDRCGFGALKQIKSGLIFQIDGGDIQRRLIGFSALGVDHLHSPIDDGKCAQAKKVKLYQAGIFDIVFIVLSNQPFTGFIAVQRRKVD